MEKKIILSAYQITKMEAFLKLILLYRSLSMFIHFRGTTGKLLQVIIGKYIVFSLQLFCMLQTSCFILINLKHNNYIQTDFLNF